MRVRFRYCPAKRNMFIHFFQVYVEFTEIRYMYISLNCT